MMMLVLLIAAVIPPLSLSDPIVSSGRGLSNRWKKSYETHNGCGKIPIKPGQDIEGTITGGVQVTQEEPFPWMVSIAIYDFINRKVERCGGSMVTDRKVLTAAHCVEKGTPDNIGLFIGLHNVEVSWNYQLISRIDIYPGYKRAQGKKKMKNAPDIAILTLEKPIRLSDKINTICLTDGLSSYVNQPAIVSGWGHDPVTTKTSLNKLMSVGVTVLSNVECKKRNRPYYSFIKKYVLQVLGHPMSSSSQTL